jgi:hypothetical protein
VQSIFVGLPGRLSSEECGFRCTCDMMVTSIFCVTGTVNNEKYKFYTNSEEKKREKKEVQNDVALS